MIGLVVAALFIALNGFFVAAEFALVKVRATSLHSRARKGEKQAIRAHKVVSRIERYLSVTQFEMAPAAGSEVTMSLKVAAYRSVDATEEKK